MAGMHPIENDTVVGTIGGTLLSVAPHLTTSDVTRTIILGALGAVISFIFTQFSKWVWRKFKRRFRDNSKPPD